LTERKIKFDLFVIQFLLFHISVSIFTDMLKTTTELITESNISKTGFQHLEIQLISAHAFENKICTLICLSFAFC